MVNFNSGPPGGLPDPGDSRSLYPCRSIRISLSVSLPLLTPPTPPAGGRGNGEGGAARVPRAGPSGWARAGSTDRGPEFGPLSTANDAPAPLSTTPHTSQWAHTPYFPFPSPRPRHPSPAPPQTTMPTPPTPPTPPAGNREEGRRGSPRPESRASRPDSGLPY
jgi:hypothetical protein